MVLYKKFYLILLDYKKRLKVCESVSEMIRAILQEDASLSNG